jgi:hypothetical protein
MTYFILFVILAGLITGIAFLVLGLIVSKDEWDDDYEPAMSLKEMLKGNWNYPNEDDDDIS